MTTELTSKVLFACRASKSILYILIISLNGVG